MSRLQPVPHPRFHSWFQRDVLFRGLRWLLALIFIYSGVVKIIDPPRFAQIIDGFGILPYPLLLPTASILPLVELVAGVGLLLNKRGSLTAITIMLVLFMAVLGYGIHLGLDIDCGCFGPEDPEQAYKGLKRALARDAGMMLIVLGLYWHGLKIPPAYTTTKTKGAESRNNPDSPS